MVGMERGSVELLQRAGDLVRSGWSQHADARTADGVAVEPWQDGAVSWSILGALVSVLEEQAERGRNLPLDDLAGALNELAGLIDDDSLTHWNDEPSRTQAEVVAALEAAETAAAAKLGNGR